MIIIVSNPLIMGQGNIAEDNYTAFPEPCLPRECLVSMSTRALTPASLAPDLIANILSLLSNPMLNSLCPEFSPCDITLRSPADGTSLPPFHSILPQSSSSSSQIYQKLPQLSTLPALGAASSTGINSGRNSNVLRTPSNESLRYHYELLNGSGRASVGPATSSLRTSSNERLHHEPVRSPYDQRPSDSFAAPLPPHGPRQSGNGMSNNINSPSSFNGRYSHHPQPSLQIAPTDYFASAGRGDRRLMNMNVSAVTSAANSDDEGDIPTEALVRPIHVLDSEFQRVFFQNDSGSTLLTSCNVCPAKYHCE